MDDQQINPDQSPPGARPPTLDYLTPIPPARPVKLKNYAHSSEAAMARSLLQSHGISAELSGQMTGDDVGVYSRALGMELYVDEDQISEAAKILDDVEQRRQARLAAAQARLNCPLCHSSNCMAFDRRLIRAAIALYALGPLLWIGLFSFNSPQLARQCLFFVGTGAIPAGLLLHFVAVGKRTCRQCGNIWTPPDDDETDDDDSDDNGDLSDYSQSKD
jgi:hypothetical protein